MGLTDRELLEGAARAAGIELKWSANPDIPPRIAQTWHSWNPLTDDGDALRLAVALSFDLELNSDWITVISTGLENPVMVPVDDNMGLSTRRAVVRAAYEIGSAKP